MQHTSEELRAWFRNVQPLCAELFNAAHVMCGNYDMAEFALRSAILDVWLHEAAGGMGFRERLRGALRREAFAAALSDEGGTAEFTWRGPAVGQDDGPILAQLGQEDIRTQRLVMLRHGCALPLRQVCRLTGMTQGQVRSELNRFEARCRRRLPAPDRARTEALIARQAKRLLSRGGVDVPRPGQVYRAFEAEAVAARSSPGPRIWRVAGGVALALMALLCAGAFWLFAVLVQPG